MAKISWIVETSAGTVTHESPTISNAQMQRFLDWVWSAYPQTEPDDSPSEKTSATVAVAVTEWAQAQWRGTKANILRHERLEAAQAASDAVSDLS